MPPPDQSPAATIRYLTRLLAAIALQHPDSTIRIPQGHLDRIVGESAGKESRLLFEDYDDNAKEVVLRFRQQSLATYMIEDPRPSQQPTQSPTATPTETASSTVPPPSPTHSNSPGRSTVNPMNPLPLALSDSQLAKAEQIAHQERVRRQLQRERQSRSSSGLEGIL